MSYVKTNGQTVVKYPYSIGELRKDYPNTSFPKSIPETTLAAYDVYGVTNAAAPVIDYRTQKATYNAAPDLIDGAWVLGITVSDKAPEQVAEYDADRAKSVRDQRDKMIADTDWMALSDNTLTPAWATYRQALRDITAHINFPHLTEDDWPVKP